MESERIEKLSWFRRAKINPLAIIITVATLGTALSLVAVITAVSLASTAGNTPNITSTNTSVMRGTLLMRNVPSTTRELSMIEAASSDVQMIQGWMDLLYPTSPGDPMTTVFYMEILNQSRTGSGPYNCNVYYVSQCSSCYSARKLYIDREIVKREFQNISNSNNVQTIAVDNFTLLAAEKGVSDTDWAIVLSKRSKADELKKIVQYVKLSADVTLQSPLAGIIKNDPIAQFLFDKLKDAKPRPQRLSVQNSTLEPPKATRQSKAILKMTAQIEYTKGEFLTYRRGDFGIAVTNSTKSINLTGMTLFPLAGGMGNKITAFSNVTILILGVTGSTSSESNKPAVEPSQSNSMITSTATASKSITVEQLQEQFCIFAQSNPPNANKPYFIVVKGRDPNTTHEVELYYDHPMKTCEESGCKAFVETRLTNFKYIESSPNLTIGKIDVKVPDFSRMRPVSTSEFLAVSEKLGSCPLTPGTTIETTIDVKEPAQNRIDRAKTIQSRLCTILNRWIAAQPPVNGVPFTGVVLEMVPPVPNKLKAILYYDKYPEQGLYETFIKSNLTNIPYFMRLSTIDTFSVNVTDYKNMVRVPNEYWSKVVMRKNCSNNLEGLNSGFSSSVIIFPNADFKATTCKQLEDLKGNKCCPYFVELGNSTNLTREFNSVIYYKAPNEWKDGCSDFFDLQLSVKNKVIFNPRGPHSLLVHLNNDNWKVVETAKEGCKTR